MSLSWCVIKSKPRQEAKALEHLENQGFETWLPSIQIEKIKMGRRVAVSEPFFSHFLFVRALIRSYINWALDRSTLARGASNTSTGPSIISPNFSVKTSSCA
jgi:transcriptional antiterminator RfaH